MLRAAFRELYCEVINPARPLMLWNSGVRRRGALFASWRRHMMQLVQEVPVYSLASALHDTSPAAACLQRVVEHLTFWQNPQPAGISCSAQAFPWCLVRASHKHGSPPVPASFTLPVSNCRGAAVHDAEALPASPFRAVIAGVLLRM